MIATDDRRIANRLRAMLDASADLIVEVGIPASAGDLTEGPRIRQLAFCECIRRVGEATAQIDALQPTFLSTAFPDIPWREVKAARNRLTHHYWTIDYTILYRVATIHLPVLTGQVAAHLGVTDPYGAAPPTTA